MRPGRGRARRGGPPVRGRGVHHVALVQVGGDTQPEFLRFAADELLPALREEYGKSDDARIAVR